MPADRSCIHPNPLIGFRFKILFQETKLTNTSNTNETNSTESRIRDNKHFASLLRRRLESRHGNGALRETLARMTDAELIEVYLANEKQGRQHAAKLRAERVVSA
jgi:hypothetical protein